MPKFLKSVVPGLLLCAVLAGFAVFFNFVLPKDLLGIALIALLLGMVLNPLVSRFSFFNKGIAFTSKKVLRLGIILTGINLSFLQVAQAGRYALILLFFTLTTSFGIGYLCSKVFHINWRLSSLLSVSTAICGGTAVATLGPTIHAKDRDIAYAISATFLFDLITVIAFPWFGRLLGLSDPSYGLWIGTAVNDTSSVVAAGYAFSDAAGQLATIVKLTRTLFIVPIVLVFSWINAKMTLKETGKDINKGKVKIAKIFPWFIVGFLVMVCFNSMNFLPLPVTKGISSLAKFFLAMALGAIGLKTSLKEVKSVGIKPMFAGIIIDTAVVIVALIAQGFILKLIP